MDYVITLSSDEESETPAKKTRIHSNEDVDRVEGEVNRLKETSVIKKANDIPKINLNFRDKKKIVDSNKKTDNCNGLKNGSAVENAVEIKDSPTENSKTANENCVNKGNLSEDEDDEEIVDYFNLNPEAKNDSVVDDKQTNNKLPISDSKKNTGDNIDENNQQPSTSKTPNLSHLEAFLEVCTNSVRKSAYESRLIARYDKLKHMYRKCDNIDVDEEFLDKIDNYKRNATKSAADAVLAFREIYKFIHDYMNSTLIEIPSENLERVKKLEKSIKALLKMLKRLESKEIDLSKDDEDSYYIKIDRYSTRLNKVYQKYCELTNTDPHSGRLLHQKINLTASKYDEINKAVAKSYKYNKFPSYVDIENVVRKCIEKHKLQLAEYEITEESRKCFKELGRILQSRRKQELHDNLSVYMSDRDPATEDPELDKRLKKNLDEGEKKIQYIIEKYAKMEETNNDENVSEESNDSHSEDEEDDDKDEDGDTNDETE